MSVGSIGQIGIGTNTPNANALLDLQSNNKGLLIPRIPKANRPANAPAGLMIFQIDNVPGFYFFSGTKWQRMYAVDDTMPVVINPSPGATTDPPATPGATGTVVGADGITYKTVRLGDGSVWLQQNLGSSRVATAADDAQSFGDLYQWGRWTDGHEKRMPVFSRTILPTEPNPNNPSGLVKQWGANVNPFYYADVVSWWATAGTSSNDTWEAVNPSDVIGTNGCDPCRLILGSTWRLPTRNEYLGIINNEVLTGVAISNGETAFASILKFPCGGRRDNYSTSLFETGNYGYYWSKTSSAVINSFGASQATRFSYQRGSSILSASTSTGPRGAGYSIRCKKD